MGLAALATGRIVDGEWVVFDCRSSLEAEMDAILTAMPVAVRADVALDVDDLEEQPGVSEASPYFI